VADTFSPEMVERDVALCFTVLMYPKGSFYWFVPQNGFFPSKGCCFCLLLSWCVDSILPAALSRIEDET